MPSERRLHPVSFLFALLGHAKQLVVPGLIVLLGARSGGDGWEIWAMVLIIPYAIAAIGRTLSYRYRFDPSELVIRTGFVFRNERHIPYTRIQNVDSVQNVLHRLFGVTTVTIETGGASESEATLSVVSLDAFQELRSRVFEERGTAQPAITTAPPPMVLLDLNWREVALCGLIQGRGLVVLGTIFGLLWEVGMIDRIVDPLFGEKTTGRGVLTQLVLAFFGQGLPPARTTIVTIAAFTLFLIVVRLFSIGWALVTLYGFRVKRAGEDLQIEFGLLTRVTATVPVRRIQAVTVHQSPLHRMLGRASIRVDTAGGEGTESAQSQRHTIAPLIRQSEIRSFVRAINPDADVDLQWNAVHPRGVRREFIGSTVVALLTAAATAVMLHWWTIPVLAAMLVWGWIHARGYVRSLGWALTESVVIFRSGWLWKATTVAPLVKIQVVALRETPFDRRHRMARVLVDTAGADSESHPVHIPYLDRSTAEDLAHALASHAARTAFRW
jgi:putative membrane protein